MIRVFEQMIEKTIKDLQCSLEEKKEIQLELQDHMYSAYEYYTKEGHSEEQAIQQVLHDFGHIEMVAMQYQQVVSPLFGFFKKLAWIGFILYSLVVLWKVMISRIIVRILEYIRADGPQPIQYVYSNISTWKDKQFFDFSEWQSNLNLQPFKMITFYVKADHVNTDIALYNLLGNFVLLMPLGVLLPFLSIRCKNILTVITVAFCTSCIVEILQFVLQIGMADIDDVLLNTLGAIAGYFIAISIFHLLSWKVKWGKFSQLR